jgi:hypothetical protein
MIAFLTVCLLAVSPPAAEAKGVAEAKVADMAFQKHEWAKAAEAYQKLTAAAPEDGVAWLRLGISLVQLGKGAPAVAPLQKAQKLGVQPSLVQYQLAQALALSGSPRDALGILEALAEADFYPVAAPAAQEKAFASLAKDPVFQKVSAAMEVNRAPCRQGDTASPYREFDFWLGDWDVVDKAGNPVGTSQVERILGGCVLLEIWRGQSGGEGRSLSSFNPGMRRWEQYWADGQGIPIFFTGRFEEGELRLRADSATRAGATLVRRVSFSKLPGGRVRQLSESSSDTGRTWAVEYDFTYVKRVPH